MPTVVWATSEHELCQRSRKHCNVPPSVSDSMHHHYRV